MSLLLDEPYAANKRMVEPNREHGVLIRGCRDIAPAVC